MRFGAFGAAPVDESAQLLIDRERAARADARNAPGAEEPDPEIPTKAELDLEEALERRGGW